MSNFDIEIEFEKQNRVYNNNEKIKGNIVIKAYKNFKCNKLEIELLWRTHGLGSIDKKVINSLILIKDKEELGAGTINLIPFCLDTPSGPISYRGIDLNLDWYVKVNMKSAIIGSRKIEEDIIINSTRDLDIFKYYFGNGKTIQATRKFVKENDMNILSLVISGIFILVSLIMLHSSISEKNIPSIMFSIIFCSLSLVSTYMIYKNKIAGIILGHPNISLTLHTPRVKVGDSILCGIKINSKSYLKLSYIKILLTNEENIINGSGSDKKTYRNIIFKDEVELLNNDYISKNSPFVKDLSFKLPEKSNPTFISDNNSLDWRIRLKIKKKYIPEWEEEYDCIVCP